MAAHREFVSGTGIADQVFRVVDGLDHGDAAALETASVRIRALFTATPIDSPRRMLGTAPSFPEVPGDAQG